MPSVKFSELFGNCIGEGSAAFDNAEVLCCDVGDNRGITAEIYSDTYIPSDVINKTKAAIMSALSLTATDFKFTFSGSAVCAAACADIVDKIRQKNVMLNGYFNDAVYTVAGDNLDITLKYGGYDTIKETDFEAQFNRIAGEMFGLSFNITFSGQCDDIEMELPPPPRTRYA